MTKLLEEAFNEINKLKPEEQDSYAKIILSELESENKWRLLFNQSQDSLSQLADEAINDFNNNKTSNLDEFLNDFENK